VTTAELRALAKRVCEEQPSRELDARIMLAAFYTTSESGGPNEALKELYRKYRTGDDP
jgi:hypothetical protein